MAKRRRATKIHRIHELCVREKVKPTVPPINAGKHDSVIFPGGAAGRAYFFPDRRLFELDFLRVNAGQDVTRRIKGPAGIYRYAVWDEDTGDFLEGSSSPIIIVLP